MFKLFIYFCILFVAFNICYASDCASALDGGLCYGNENKFGYDVTKGQCTSFVYGGCGGNDNRYDSLAACKAACEK